MRSLRATYIVVLCHIPLRFLESENSPVMLVSESVVLYLSNNAIGENHGMFPRCPSFFLARGQFASPSRANLLYFVLHIYMQGARWCQPYDAETAR